MEVSKLKGKAAEVSLTTVSHQLEAKNFVACLMGGDEVTMDGGNPSEAELEILKKKVTRLSEESLSIVASITGAKSPAVFAQGFTTLTTTDLKAMRKLFRQMGLQS